LLASGVNVIAMAPQRIVPMPSGIHARSTACVVTVTRMSDFQLLDAHSGLGEHYNLLILL
jgi:hypothetical protein